MLEAQPAFPRMGPVLLLQVKNLSLCFYQLTIACMDIFLEETWQDMSHLPPGEQLDRPPLMPTL